MLDCRQARILGRHFFKVCRLYRTAFPKIERHPVMELFSASSGGRAEFLRFSENGKFIGLAYMIVSGSVAFLLYLAVDGRKRSMGYGSAMLKAIKKRYDGKDVVLLIESLHEECGNMDIRVRRKGFYLRNGFHDTGFLQRSCGGEANYDILSTAEQFDEEAYGHMLRNYPFKSYLEDYSIIMKEISIETLKAENAIDLIAKEWMLVTAGTKESYNTMTANWGGIGYLWNRNVAFVFVRPERYTHDFIEREDRFTLSFYPEAYREALNVCGTKSGRDIDKAAETGLIPEALPCGAMTFAQARMTLQCRKLFKAEMKDADFIDRTIVDRWYGSHGGFHTVYVVEIEKVFAGKGE